MDTSAIMGSWFLNGRNKGEKPDHLAVAFDKGDLRNDFPEYKAHRDATPEAIK
jgi:DNA polymerase-1